MIGHGTISEGSSLTSLKERIERKLKPDLLADQVRISDYRDLPFAILLYDPHEEFELRQELTLLENELFHRKGRLLKQINLSELMWTAIQMVAPPEALFEAEREQGLPLVIDTIHNILAQDDQAPLHQLVMEYLNGMDPHNEVAFLTRAGSLFPVFRTSALLENIKGVKVPTILCYPGRLHGAKGLSFMDEFEPDTNYRPRIY